MKKIKKLGVVAIAFAMCMLLGITVWAAGDSTFSYTVQPETSQMCVSNEARTVTLTVQANKPLDVSSIGATIVVSGCELESVSVPGSILGADDFSVYNPETKDFAWVSGDAGNRSTQELIVIKVTVPAGTGTYSVEVKDVLLTQWTDTIETLTSLTTTAKAEIAVVDHDYAVTYNFAEDGSSCTANGVCKYDAAHTVTATATITSEQTKAPTCEVMGKTKYTATFTEAWAKTQTKTVADVPVNPANHTSKEVTYVDNEGDTHTVKHTCCGATETPVEHTYNQEGDKCVCGAEEPVKDVAVTYKGTALANAFTVEGNVVTVTYTLACKVGYWDEVAGKYVALTATKISDNTYSFTAPEGVTEVLLVVKGDISGDGKVNAKDKSIFNKSMLDSEHINYDPLTDPLEIFAADLNNDGKVNAKDKSTFNKSMLDSGHVNYAEIPW